MDAPLTTLTPSPPAGMVERVQELTTALSGDLPDSPGDAASAEGRTAAAAAVDELRALESLVCAAQARQAALAVSLPESKGTGSQVGLARRVSPVKGRSLLGLAKILTAGELPHTWAAFRAGLVSEWRVCLIARETACLTLEHRLRVDAEVAGNHTRLEAMGDRAIIAACLEWANRLDPAATVARRRQAQTQRRVGLRPAPDEMTWLTALLPVADGVASYARLQAASERARLSGDDRSRGQVMADTLVDAITDHAGRARKDAYQAATTWGPRTGPGHDSPEPEPASEAGADAQPEPATGSGAEPGTEAPQPDGPTEHCEPAIVGEMTTTSRDRSDVCLNLIMTDRTLFGTADDTAWLDGYGPIDPELARELAKTHRAWLRRLFADPTTGQLIAMDAKARYFPTGLRTLIRLRDRACRTPWCDAPIRHTDHVTPAAQGGTTSYDNGQGLCEACNQAKETTGWTAQRLPGAPGGHWIQTPTGHRYRSRPPAAPGHQPRPRHQHLRVDLHTTRLDQLIRAG